MKVFNCFLIICLFSLSLFACISLGATRPLDELKLLYNINRIEIWGKNQNEKGEWESYQIKTIEDLGEINPIVETFKAYADDWEYGQYYPYIPGRLTITFYAGKKPMTSIMIVYLKNEQTSTYFLSQEYGPAKPIIEAEFRELIEVLEVDENLALNP